jgi:hypothetical protein
MKRPHFSFSAAALVFASSLLFTPVHAGPVLPPVGPTPPGAYEQEENGFLRVFSRTEQTEWGDNTYYYIHTAYWIYNADGRRIRTVANHDTSIDEDPQKVALAPGTYTVQAWSDNDGLVTVPVIIKRGQFTTVNLEQGRHAGYVDGARAVKTPSGQIVGWKG